LNEEIKILKENMKNMYDTNVELYESCEKLSKKKKENIKRNGIFFLYIYNFIHHFFFQFLIFHYFYYIYIYIYIF